MNLETFSRPLEVKDISFSVDAYGHDQVQIDYFDVGAKYPRTVRAWFKGDRNVEVGHNLKVGDKFHVQVTEYDKKSDKEGEEGKWVHVKLMSIFPASTNSSSKSGV